MRRVAGLLAAWWAGVLACIAGIATPAAFSLLPRPEAGRVAGRILATEAYLSLALGMLLFVMERRRARDLAESGRGSQMSTELLLVLGSLFCTVAGYFGLQPLMEAARAGQGTWSFGALHAASSVFFALKGVLVLLLAWRLSRPGPAS